MLRCLVTPTLIVSSAIALTAPNVKAQSVDLQFQGTVSANCTFGTVTPGKLSFRKVVFSRPEDSLVGEGGVVSVNCISPVNISISAPTKISGPGVLAPTRCEASFNAGDGTPTVKHLGCGGSSTSPSPISGSKTLQVGMTVLDDSGVIEPGDYVFRVTLSIVP
jgi:hypothetical protein